MGAIRLEVRPHLEEHSDEELWLKAFTQDFFVTWGRETKILNTKVSAYFLNPEPHISESFGFEQELLLIYSKYKTVEPRAIQAVEAILAQEPARGRVEKLSYILVSEDPNIESWVENYATINKESRLIVPIFAGTLRAGGADQWLVRNKLNQYLFGRDLFDIRLPLEKDTYFFGRSDLVKKLLNSIKRSENRAIFGLRKTGKTSLLFKLERLVKEENVADVIYVDCKLPSVRKLRWFELVKKICNELGYETSELEFDEISAADSLIKVIRERTNPALIIFDEIEYISPVAVEDRHWHKDFIDFWQTFWACQSRHRLISTVIAGVNPTVVEMDQIGGVQNPLFGIVSFEYLTGLTDEETRNMVRSLGKRMGMRFEFEALKYLFDRYGGHPLLTRLACSYENTEIVSKTGRKPVDLTVSDLNAHEASRDAELTFYCRHVISELFQFYKDEYEMLEMLASKQLVEFADLANYPEFTKHLKSYGLLKINDRNQYSIAIPVVGRYLALDLARREKRKSILRVVPKEGRKEWLEKRIRAISNDFRSLEDAIRASNSTKLFGPNSFPEADYFARINVVDGEQGFENFINVCNRCFVESVETYGKSIGANSYYWNEIKSTYPTLWHALHRIKLYRHHNFHLVLKATVTEEILEYLECDLEGKQSSMSAESYFVLQQCTLDDLLLGIQSEISLIV